MSHVFGAVISRFLTLYGEPRTDNHEALYGEYVRALKHFDAEALNAAVDEIVKMHTFPTWPTPGEIYKQALTEAQKFYVKRNPQRPVTEAASCATWERPSDEQRAHNSKMIEDMRRLNRPMVDEVEIEAPTRQVMEAIQARAMRTVDGRRRHLKDWHPNLNTLEEPFE